MSDSIYIEIIGNSYKAIFKQIIRDCDLSEEVANILTGDTPGKYINRTSFTDTINNGILIEVPFSIDLSTWQTVLLNYIENALPSGLVNKVFYHTREQAIEVIKTSGGLL